MTAIETRPLWALCTLNDDTLSESTPGGYSFDYVDISSVTEGRISNALDTLAFRDAPSRARRLARDGDVIVSTVRTYLRAIAQVTEAEESRVYSTGFAVLRPVHGATDPRYLAYVLTSKQVMDEVIATSVGVSYPAIQGTALHRIRVPYHSLDRQRTMVDYLDRETGTIDAMIGKLDELASALKIRRATMVRADLTGFPVVAMGYHCRIVNGSTPLRSRNDFWTDSGGVPWLNSSSVNSAVVREATRQVTAIAIKQCHLPEVEPGDLLIGITGQGRTRGMVARSGIKCTISQHVAAIRPQSGWEVRFLYYALDAAYLSLREHSEGGGSTKGAITCEMLSQYRVPMPPTRDEQIRIADRLDEVTFTIDAMLGKVAELKALLLERRAALITDVVTGGKEVA